MSVRANTSLARRRHQDPLIVGLQTWHLVRMANMVAFAYDNGFVLNCILWSPPTMGLWDHR